MGIERLPGRGARDICMVIKFFSVAWEDLLFPMRG